MLSNHCNLIAQDFVIKKYYQIFVIEIYNCFVIKSSARSSLRKIIEHDDDIALFSLLQINFQTNQLCESIDFSNCKQQQKRRVKQFLVNEEKINSVDEFCLS